MNGSVAEASTRAVLRVWMDRLGGGHLDLPSAGVVTIAHERSPVLAALRLEDVVILSGTKEVLAACAPPAPGQPFDIDELCEATRQWSPEPLGVARIALLGRDGVIGEPARKAIEVDRASVASLVARLSRQEADECGLLEMLRWWAVLDDDGEPFAAAGFEIWNGSIAQMGVAVRHDARGRGLAGDVARAACIVALHDGLIPQWRSEISHEASQRTGGSLGFAPVGEQLAIVLADIEGRG